MLLTQTYCLVCNGIQSHHNGRCGACMSAENEMNRKAYHTRKEKLTNEQRLREIEEWIYSTQQEEKR